MSKFSGIFEARKQEAPAVAPEPEPEGIPLPSPAPADAPSSNGKLPRAAKAKPADPKSATEEKKRGRPRGKRSDTDYVQVTAYIRQETHLAVKVALLEARRGQEFSELLEELLTKWLKSRI